MKFSFKTIIFVGITEKKTKSYSYSFLSLVSTILISVCTRPSVCLFVCLSVCLTLNISEVAKDAVIFAMKR